MCAVFIFLSLSRCASLPWMYFHINVLFAHERLPWIKCNLKHTWEITSRLDGQKKNRVHTKIMDFLVSNVNCVVNFKFDANFLRGGRLFLSGKSMGIDRRVLIHRNSTSLWHRASLLFKQFVKKHKFWFMNLNWCNSLFSATRVSNCPIFKKNPSCLQTFQSEFLEFTDFIWKFHDL